jgi:short-subunit dehydrogenase
MHAWTNKVVLVTGGSAGFGRVLAGHFAQRGAKVIITARDREKLEAAATALSVDGRQVKSLAADVTRQADVDRLLAEVQQEFGRLDVLVNNAGRSARGAAIETSVDEFRDLVELNFLALVRCTQAAMPLLLESQGHLVNIGSLAAKTVSPHLGAYPASKFPVAAYSHQLRLELGPLGVHVLLVCPGPIRLERAERYAQLAAEKNLPESAAQPGAGVKLKGLDPDWLAERVIGACEKRQAELVAPSRARLLFAISALWPRLGDWIIRKMT